jgi:hypothetical protein
MRSRALVVPIAAGLLFAPVLTEAAAPAADGPYVLRGADGRYESWNVDLAADGTHKRIESLQPGATLKIPAVGAYPWFNAKLRPPADIAPDVVRTSKGAPLFVVADTHGEYEILAQMLTSQKIVDAKLAWSFGKGHLVIVGDVFDRGPNQLEILWLLYSLEAQAAKAGGGVHLVLGNHETMALRGDLRYLHPKYVESARTLGVTSYSELFPTDSVLGQWLRSKPTVLKIDEFLCLHGGISRALVDRKLSLSDINGAVRDVLGGKVSSADAARADFVMSQVGPLWYRGYFVDQPEYPSATAQDVDATLMFFGVKRILVGHTIVPTITPLFDGKVIAVQVYPKREGEQVIFESLLIRGGKFFRAKPDGSTQPLN